MHRGQRRGRDVPIASSEFASAIVGGIRTKQSGRHTRPSREDHERKQITKRHRPPPALIQPRTSRTTLHLSHALVWLALVKLVPCICVVKQPDQKRNRARNVDKGVCTIDPSHDELVLHEEALNGQFPEYVYPLLHGNDLQGVFSCGEYGPFDYPDCCGCSTELVDLRLLVRRLCILNLGSLPSRLTPNTNIQPRTETSRAGD